MYKKTIPIINHLLDNNLNPDDVKIWTSKYTALKYNAKLRGVDCFLDIYQYISLAVVAGISDVRQIGRARLDQYQMGRIGDSGDYHIGNCRFITFKQNLQELKDNGGSASQAIKVSISNSKGYRLISPDGEIFEGRNISKFCKEHNLHVGNITNMLRGKLKHSKGWTGNYMK